ncbi:MAG: GH92 family glycosyl hydrolase [Bacteroidota bacterium]
MGLSGVKVVIANRNHSIKNKLFFVFITLCACSKPIPETLTNYVDPFIGTGGHGHTYPGATVPFGMMQLSPDSGNEGWDWSSGYHYSDSSLLGFSHTHLSGTGIGDMGDIMFLPGNGPAQIVEGKKEEPDTGYRSRFTHHKEQATPGYYQVDLLDDDISVELTATERAGYQKYLFNNAEDPWVLIDLRHGIGWDWCNDGLIEIVNDTLITGYRKSDGWAKNQIVYFAAIFSKPVKKYQLFKDDTIAFEGSKLQNNQIKYVLEFDIKAGEELHIKSGISYNSIENALLNVNVEIPHWNFDQVRKEADQKWEKELGKLQIEADEKTKRIFYTALYHSALAPIIYQDINGEYRGSDFKTHKADGFVNHTIYSLWDTYRASHPLFTFLQSERMDDFLKSMYAQHKEYGLLPKWSLVSNETNTMIGYHAIPVIVDAWFKGYIDLPADSVLNMMLKSAYQKNEGIQYFDSLGFIPLDKVPESVSKALEYAYDDWCISQLAKVVNHPLAERMQKRGLSFENHFKDGFARGKLLDSTWQNPFDPRAVSHRSGPFTEANSWQYSWSVQHEPYRLIELMGGDEAFIKRLDEFFNEDSGLRGNIPPDVTGLIGQYAHGNEPSHHIAYFYNYAGKPWKAQEKVRLILDSLYSDQPDGLPGNEDCGQMSAWYIFSALGFYPFNPASGVYTIGTPIVKKAEMKLPNGRVLLIRTKNLSEENKYIERLEVDGEPWNQSYFTHRDLLEAEEIVYIMNSTPNHEWAVANENRPLLFGFNL